MRISGLAGVVLLFWLGWGGSVACGAASQSQHLKIATTTSVADSGLLDVLLPPFERRFGVKLDYIAVGTGQALGLGRRGDVDLVLVHDPEQEEGFVAEGYGVERTTVMFNDFVLLGPEGDPAQIKGLASAALALRRIAEARATFISRGDGSGTHAKERALWRGVGVEPKGEWYLSTGQGMGETLMMADERNGYTLSDRGTYLALKKRVRLAILVEGEPVLFNPYSVIAVNPAKHATVKYDLAKKLIDYLLSAEGQEIIAEFGKDRYGQPLFSPKVR